MARAKQSTSSLTATQIEELSETLISFRHDPHRFTMFAFPWGEVGTPLEHETGPDRWQFESMNEVGAALATIGKVQQATASGKGVGKAQPKDMMLHTPDGLRRWGDLQVGDYVFGADGSPTRITATHDQGVVEVYRVTFDDRSSTVVCGDHLWNVKGRNERRRDAPTKTFDQWQTYSTIELCERGLRFGGKLDAKMWEIPQQGAAQFPHKDVPIHPYTLGCWLGDGCRNTGRITIAESEVLSRFVSIDETYSDMHGSYGYTIYGLHRKLITMGICDKYSYQKSVPVEYLENDAETRAEVLRGLLDTDGEASNTSGAIIFSSTSKALADDVAWLVRSLGGKAKFNATKYPKFPGPDGVLKDGLPCHRVNIRMPDGFQSFYIKRKQERVQQVVEQRYLTRWIDTIEPCGFADSMCISVENEDGLYQTNDFIVTHNSTMGAWMTLWAMYTEVDTKGRVTANTESQMRTTTWPEVAKWYNLMMPALREMFILTATSLYSTAPGKEKTWRCDAVTWSKNNVEAFAGLHNKGRRIYVLFDEASAIADPVWDTTDGIMSDANTEVIWLALGNPTQATGRFRQCWGKLRAQWIRRKVDSRTVKITDKKKLAEQIEAYGEDSDYVRKYILGEFPNSANSQFYGGALIEAAMARDPVAYIYEPLLMGVDVARYGDDSTVISFRRGRDACSIPWVKLRGWSIPDVAAKVAELKREHFVDMIFVDGGGVGGGVVDILRKAGHELFEVNSASKADSGIKLTRPIKLKNKRSEMHAIFREWLENGSLPDDTELEDEMVSIEYYYDSDDRMLLERKEDMKSRGLGSPDCFVAGTMVLTPNGERPIESLRIGDEVLTPVGVRKIIATHAHEEDVISSFTFPNGRTLMGKPTHKIFTWDKGWVPLASLTTDLHIEPASIRRLIWWSILSSLFMTTDDIGFKALVNIGRGGHAKASDFFIGASGQMRMGRFHPNIISITLMAIGRTIVSKTLNAFLNQNITDSTVKSGGQTKKLQMASEPIWMRSGFWHLLGTSLMRGVCGIRRTLQNLGKSENHGLQNALSAAANTKHFGLTPGFAPHVACNGRRLEDTKTLNSRVSGATVNSWATSRNGFAIDPAQRSSTLASAVTAIRKEPVMVYDITLDRDNVYWANGILVENCVDSIALTFAFPVAEKIRTDIQNALLPRSAQAQEEYNPYG